VQKLLELLKNPGFTFGLGVLSVFLFLFLMVAIEAIRKKMRTKNLAGKLPALPDNPDELKATISSLKADKEELEKKLKVDHEREKNVAAAFNSRAIPVLLAFGGLWTFFTALGTRQLEAAAAAYESRQFFRIDLELRATQLSFPAAKEAPRFVQVDVTWVNRVAWVPDGEQVLDFAAGEFKMLRIEAIKPDGAFELRGPELMLHPRIAIDRLASAEIGHSNTIPETARAIQAVPLPGLYVVWIRAKLGDSHPGATTFIYVK